MTIFETNRLTTYVGNSNTQFLPYNMSSNKSNHSELHKKTRILQCKIEYSTKSSVLYYRSKTYQLSVVMVTEWHCVNNYKGVYSPIGSIYRLWTTNWYRFACYRRDTAYARSIIDKGNGLRSYATSYTVCGIVAIYWFK